MKKVSLKKLKELRDFINENMPNYLEQRAYIIAHGLDIETKKPISVLKRYNEFSERTEANWSYFLVMGYPTKQEHLPK